MGVGPVCQTPLPTGLSECELGPHHTEGSPVDDVILKYLLRICYCKWSARSSSLYVSAEKLDLTS